MRWGTTIALFVAGSFFAMSEAASAQVLTAAEKQKAAEAAKLQAQKPATATAVPPLTHAAPVAVPIAPLKLRPTIKLPSSGAAPPAAVFSVPFRTSTGALRAVGSAAAVAAAQNVAPFTPVRLTTGDLGAVGTGVTAAPASFEPVRLRTAPMGAVAQTTGG